MPVFTDSEFAFNVVDEGDYILCVSEFETGVSTGKNTSGAETFTVIFDIEGTGSKVRETLIDHEKTLWKIDAFVKACGIRNLEKGQAYHFEKDRADELGVPWINPMGLRCHARLEHDSYVSQRSGKDVTKMVVKTFYTDKDPLKPDARLRGQPTKLAAQKEGNRKTPF